MVSSACRDGRRLVAVTINAPNDWQDHKSLLEAGFQDYTLQSIVTKGQSLGMAEIAGGEAGVVSLRAGEAFSYPLRAEEIVSVQLPAPGFVYAPVAKNQNAGYAYICIDGVAIGKVSIYYDDTVEIRKDR